MSEPEQVTANVDALLGGIQNLENLLAPLLDKKLDFVTKQLTPLDAAKLYSAVAYSLSSLEVSYLRLSGINHTQHAVMGDLKRIQESMGRITATATMLRATAEQEQAEKQKKDGMDTVAAVTQQNNMNDSVTPSTPVGNSSQRPPMKAKKRKA